jgi:hypothetical protein
MEEMAPLSRLLLVEGGREGRWRLVRGLRVETGETHGSAAVLSRPNRPHRVLSTRRGAVGRGVSAAGGGAGGLDNVGSITITLGWMDDASGREQAGKGGGR